MGSRRRARTSARVAGWAAGPVAAALGAQGAGATSVRVVSPTTDSYVTATDRGSVFRAQSYLKVSGRSGERRVAYVRFRVAGAADGSVVTAKLLLSRVPGTHLAGTIQASIVPLGTFDARHATWRNRPTLGPVLASTHVSGSTRKVTLTLTTATTDAIYSSGWVTFAITATSRNASQFASQNARTGRPVLIVTNAPTTIAQRPICPVSTLLVPACGRYWGAAPGDSDLTTWQRVAAFETEASRPIDIVHRYASNGTLFPTPDDIGVSSQPGQNRILFYTWRPGTDHTWAGVAGGGVDARIDAEATYLKAVYGRRMLLAIAPRPESSVNQKTGSGMTAADYAAMYRHVVERLRARGVANAVFVMDYSATPTYGAKSWFPRLWPGDDVVDWVGYSAFGPAGTSLARLVNRPGTKWPGFYTWATATHPTKPLMLAEWGIYGSPSATAKAASFASMAAQIPQYPLIRAFVYEEFGSRSTGTRPDTDAAGLTAFGALGQNPAFISAVVVLQ